MVWSSPSQIGKWYGTRNHKGGIGSEPLYSFLQATGGTCVLSLLESVTMICADVSLTP